MELDPILETFLAAALRGIGLLVRRLRGEPGDRTVRIDVPRGPVTVVVVVLVPAPAPTLEVEADDDDAT